MKKLTILLLVFITLIVATACTKDDEWVEYDYSNPEAKFKAEQLLKIPDDDKFEDFYECKVWASKRSVWGLVLTTEKEYFEGYMAIPDGFDVYVFVYDIKGEYPYGDYTECKVVDFNDTPYEEFKEHDGYKGHYRIDKIQIKSKS